MTYKYLMKKQNKKFKKTSEKIAVKIKNRANKLNKAKRKRKKDNN